MSKLSEFVRSTDPGNIRNWLLLIIMIGSAIAYLWNIPGDVKQTKEDVQFIRESIVEVKYEICNEHYPEVPLKDCVD